MATVLTLGGKERELHFELAGFTAAQVRYKIRVPMSSLADPTLADLPVFIWIGLLKHYPRLDLATVVKWIDEDEDFALFDAMPLVMGEVNALFERLGAKEDAEPGEGPEAVEDLLAPLE